MQNGLERHHLCWTRASWSESSIRKRVRGLPEFIILATQSNHRLLHATVEPPPIPANEVLGEIRRISKYGLEVVMKVIDDAFIENIEQQLSVLTIDPVVALHKLQTGDYIKTTQ